MGIRHAAWEMMGGLGERLGARGRKWLAGLPLSSWAGVRSGFIVSTGRTGTQRLADVIGSATSGVLACHEPSPDLFHLGEETARGSRSVTEAARELRCARQPLCNRVTRLGMDAFVESNTNAGYLADAIRTVFDRPRFVHIVRDGRDVVRSLYSKACPSRRPGEAQARFLDHDDHRCRLAAVDFAEDPWAGAWHEMSRFERICWHWAKKNALIREALGPHQDTLVVRFDEIFDERTDHRGFWKVVEFLGIAEHLILSLPQVHELLAIPSNRTERHRLPASDEWNREFRERFDSIAGAEQCMYFS